MVESTSMVAVQYTQQLYKPCINTWMCHLWSTYEMYKCCMFQSVWACLQPPGENVHASVPPEWRSKHSNILFTTWPQIIPSPLYFLQRFEKYCGTHLNQPFCNTDSLSCNISRNQACLIWNPVHSRLNISS